MPRRRPHRPRPTAPAVPRAFLDPIDDLFAALAVFEAALDRPLRPQTLAFLLDADNRSGTITIVGDTDDPEAIGSVVELLCQQATMATIDAHATIDPDDPPGAGPQRAEVCGLVVATVRPSGVGADPLDADRWRWASTVADLHGIELVEWYVIGRHAVWLPRAVAGEPSRW